MRVAIVEDDPSAAAVLRAYLARTEIEVLAVYPTAEQALEGLTVSPTPDVVLVDLGLPGMSGLELIGALKAREPTLEIVVQSVFEDAHTIVAAIMAGAAGYVLKAAPREEYVRALRECHAGGAVLSARVARKVLRELQRPSGAGDAIEQFGLTRREEEILRCLIGGASFKEIAERLGLSPHTVGNHVRKVYQKLRVRSRGEAVARATNRA